MINTRGRFGAQYMKAVTLQNIMTHLVHCIVKYTHDSQTAKRTGLELLVHHDLLSQLEQEVADSEWFRLSLARIVSKYPQSVIETYKLSRHQNHKLYLGRMELKLMIQTLLHDLTAPTFLSRVQLWNSILVIYHCTSRPSSISAAHKKFAEQEKVTRSCIGSFTCSSILIQYLKLGDFEVFCLAIYSWQVKMTIKNFKVTMLFRGTQTCTDCFTGIQRRPRKAAELPF